MVKEAAVQKIKNRDKLRTNHMKGIEKPCGKIDFDTFI